MQICTMSLENGECKVAESTIRNLELVPYNNLPLTATSEIITDDTVKDGSKNKNGFFESNPETDNVLESVSHKPETDEANDSLPQYFEFVMDDSVPSDTYYMTDKVPTVTTPLTEEDTSDLSFITAEDSISMSDSHFHTLLHSVENVVTSSSSCFSRNSQVPCDDHQESPKSKTTSPVFFDAVVCQEQEELATVEESSMDSGLGSVDSAYANSGEESASSPDVPSAPSSPEEQQDPPQYNLDERIEKFCDRGSSFNFSNKRQHESNETVEEPAVKKAKKQNNVEFSDVTVFYFPRRQSFVTVPSQGGSTLGMGMEHVHCQTMTLQEHKQAMREKHKEKVREHIREQKVENKIKQLKLLNPDLDDATLSSMATSDINSNESSVDSDSDDLLNNVDDYFFLQPISTKKRRKILRMAGVSRIDGEEKLMNRITRQYREQCGCSCDGICMPITCECALAGIQCQVDRESFPCGCISAGCRNVNGRVEFDSERVRRHFEATMQRLRRSNEDPDSLNKRIVFSDDQGKETESISSIDSECDLLSSDDADQSEAEGGEFNQVAYGIEANFAEYSESANLQTMVNNPSQVGSTDDKSVTMDNFATQNQGNVTRLDSNLTMNEGLNCLSAEQEITDEFLNTLGLRRIESKVFSHPPEESETPVVLGQTASSAPSNFFFTANEFQGKMNSYDSVANGDFSFSSLFSHQNETVPQVSPSQSNTQNTFTQFASDPAFTHTSPPTTSMFGTTSTKKDGEGNPVTRECAVLLDPIATFMSAHNFPGDVAQPSLEY